MPAILNLSGSALASGGSRLAGQAVRLAMACLLAVIALGAAGAARAAQFVSHTYPELGVSFELPAGWRLEPRQGGRRAALVFAGAKGREEAAATVNCQVVARHPGQSLNAVAADLEKQWSGMPGYQMLRREAGNLDGAPGLRLTVRHQDPGGGGAWYRRDSVLVERGCCFYFLAYTAPERIFDRHRFVMNRLLDTFRFSAPPASQGQGAAAVPASEHRELVETAAFAPAALPIWAGPLYSPSLDDGSPLGSEIAADHRRLVGDLHGLLQLLAQSQAKLLPLLDALVPLYLAQCSLVEEARHQLKGGPDAWQKTKDLLRRQLDYAQMQAAQSGAAEAAAQGLPPAQEISSDLAAVQALVTWQQALSDQQAMILAQLEGALLPSLLLHASLTDPSSGLIDHQRLRLAQLNAREQRLMSQILEKINQANQYTARLAMFMNLLEAFQKEAARAYALRLRAELPALQREAGRLRQAGQAEAAELLTLSLAQLEAAAQTAAGGKPSQTGLGERFWEFLVPSAHARRSAWEFGRDFLAMGGAIAYTLGKTAVVDVPRVVAAGVRATAGHVELGYTRISQDLSFAAYSPLRVTTPASQLIGDPKDIKDPKWAGRQEELARKLEELKSRHDASNLSSYQQLKNQSLDKAWQGYRKGEWGVSALKQGAQDLEDFSTKKLPGAVKAVVQAPARLVLGETAGNAAGAAVAYVPGAVLAVASKTVTDIPKSVMVLCNNKASWADHGKAYYDLAGTFGASALALKGTALAVGRKLAPYAASAAQKGLALASRMVPASAAASQVGQKLVAPVARKIGEMAARGVEKALATDNRLVAWAGKKLVSNMEYLAALTKGGVAKTLGRETLEMAAQVTKNLAFKGDPLQVLSRFAAENLTLRGLKQSALNDTFSDKVLHPILKAAEKFLSQPPPPPPPAPQPRPASPQKAERSFENDNLAKAGRDKIERGFKAENLNRLPKPAGRPEGGAVKKPAKEDALLKKAERAAKRPQEMEAGPVPQDKGIPVIPVDCTIEMVSWSSAAPEQKNKEAFRVNGDQVTGETSYTFTTDKYHNANWRCEPSRTSGVFQGTIKDNVITGTWRMTNHRYNCQSYWDRGVKDQASGKYNYSRVRCDYSMWGTHTVDMVITLNLDKSIRGTYSGQHTSHTQYGPDCWENMKNTTKTNNSSFSWDDPKMPAEYRNKPITGIWQIRSVQKEKP